MRHGMFRSFFPLSLKQFILKIVLSTKKLLGLANKTKSKLVHYTVGVLSYGNLDLTLEHVYINLFLSVHKS